MNDQLKRSIQNAFDAPPPDKQRKKQFLRDFPQPKITMTQFVFSQLADMSNRTLLLSVVLLLPALFVAYQIREYLLWVISSFMPFLGLLAVSESTRSTKYEMCELEMTTRFSLKSIVLARMSIVGLMDLLILCFITPFCCIGSEFLLFQTGILLLIPYLLTVNICLWITRHFHRKENIYGCMSITFLISGVGGRLHYINALNHSSRFLMAWAVIAVFLLAGLAYEIGCTIKETEELAWS